MNVMTIMLQAAGGGSAQFLIMMVLIFGVMYFLMIRPQQKKQKESFVEYAKNHGIDEAYRKYNSMDKSLLNEAVKAYCDTMDLDYISINYSLKRIIRSEDSEIVLVGKYKIICETIKHAGNVNESAVQSSVGYSCASTIHKTYISKAIELLK